MHRSSDARQHVLHKPIGEGEPEVVTNYRYNGLGMRIMWQSDLDAGGTLEDSERTYAAYDSRWRVVATFADDAGAPAEAFVHHAAGFGGSGGSSYIDSVILRDRDADTDESHTLEERRYFCQNWRADVVAVTKSDGTPLEYVRYSAYGEPTVYPLADVNMDGVVDSTDYAIWVNIVAGGAAGAEVVGADLNFDGTADAAESDGYDFYESYDANVGLSGKNHVSSPGVANCLGYAGYEWDDVLKADHVRHRVYFPDIGRWSRRDPVGYVDGMNLLAYCDQSPVRFNDALGLERRRLPGEFFACRNKCGTASCLNAYRLSEKARGETQKRFPNTRNVDDAGDAWRHCYWSCLMTQEIGFNCAKYVGDNHEYGGRNPDNLMDLHNNAIGRSVALSGSDCALGCIRALRSGRLVTSLGSKKEPPSTIDYYEYEYKNYSCSWN